MTAQTLLRDLETVLNNNIQKAFMSN